MNYTIEFTQFPNTLIVSLERIEEENGFKKNVRHPVGISDNGLIIKKNN